MSQGSCPNCNAPVKKEGFFKNEFLNTDAAILIRQYSTYQSEKFCLKCGLPALQAAKEKLAQKTKYLEKKLQPARDRLLPLLKHIVIVTTHTPLHWDYETLGVVTGQSTTGTGMFSEIDAIVSDFFGGQSAKYNTKLAKGEELCMAQLRAKALTMGGNAIIATDIDYSEVGGAKGMLMVCMAGTAVRLKNLEILGNEKEAQLQQVTSAAEELAQLEREMSALKNNLQSLSIFNVA